MSNALEVVIFKAKAGINPEQVQRAANAAEPHIRQMPGFVERHFGTREDGTFIDLVHWQDQAAAEAAAEKVMQMPEFGEFFALIDDSTVQMMHFDT
jgi:heme-degrading monooxygenase HmoA